MINITNIINISNISNISNFDFVVNCKNLGV